ncbi:MAG: hypothetical protein F4X74_03725 [Acidimicrobiia bacterium]|nr:hypothetical protein [Acidimicrobiia bacterium]
MTEDRVQAQRPMLHGRRKLIEETVVAEAQGKSLWTDQLDERVRHRICYALEKIRDEDQRSDRGSTYPVDKAWKWTAEDLGLPSPFPGYNVHRFAVERVMAEQEESEILSFVEAVIFLARTGGLDIVDNFIETVREILLEHRVSFDLVDGQFVPFSSRVLHESVVVPALTLLGSRKSLHDVEKAYHSALNEIHTGSPGDAITDAATAVQLTLEVLGCDGETLGPLAKSAQRKGIVTGYDEKLIHWVSADRSNKGDAHKVDSASVEDAWLVVHVVGALILRIADGPLRLGDE